MKKSKLLFPSATLALAISAAFATKVNKSFAGISTGFITVSGANDGIIKNVAVGRLLTSVSTSHQKAYFFLCTEVGTKVSAPVALFTSPSSGNPVYIH